MVVRIGIVLNTNAWGERHCVQFGNDRRGVDAGSIVVRYSLGKGVSHTSLPVVRVERHVDPVQHLGWLGAPQGPILLLLMLHLVLFVDCKVHIAPLDEPSSFEAVELRV
jgi:hypothetical protein